jgi:ParB-like nuclease domain
MKFHPACQIFPELSGAEFVALIEDIRAHGLREPILLDTNGAILDGRNRYRACEELGIQPRTRVWKPKDGDSPLALVVSMNLTRRHLDAGQIAGVTLKLARLRPKPKLGRPKKGELESAPTLEHFSGRAVEQACEITGASKSYVYELQSLIGENEALLEEVIAGEGCHPGIEGRT